MSPSDKKNASPCLVSGRRGKQRAEINSSTETALLKWRMAVAALSSEELLDWISTSDGLAVSLILLSLPEPLSRKLGHEMSSKNNRRSLTHAAP